MDQATSVLGKSGGLLLLVCQLCTLQQPVYLPHELALWAIDSGVKHSVTGIEYEAARAAAFVGYRMICEAEEQPVSLDESSKIPRFITGWHASPTPEAGQGSCRGTNLIAG